MSAMEVQVSAAAARVLERARRRSDEIYVLAVLEAAGEPPTAELRAAAQHGGHALVAVLPDGSLRLHDCVETAEPALLAAAAAHARGPITPRDLAAAARADYRLSRVRTPGEEPRARRPPDLAPVTDGPRDLVAAAPHPVAGRRAEVAALMVRLARRHRPHIALLGEPRSGRRATMLCLANALAGADGYPQPPPGLAGARILELEAATLGRDLSRLDLRAVAARGDIIFVRTGNTEWLGKLLPADVLAALRVVARLTPEQYAALQTQPDALGGLEPAVRIERPSDVALRAMIAAQAGELERHHGVAGDERVIDVLLQWAADRRAAPMPAAALEILDEALAGCRERTLGVEHLLHALGASGRAAQEQLDTWYLGPRWDTGH